MNWIKHLMGGQEIALHASADHVELTADHLVIGLELSWQNRTAAPISVKDIQLQLVLSERGKEPLRFYPLERFEHVSNRRALQKKSIRPFTLPPDQPHAEQIRFISQEVRDIPAGKYEAAIDILDLNEISHRNEITLRFRSEIKYRQSEEWERD
jgi:hypothetical protein